MQYKGYALPTFAASKANASVYSSKFALSNALLFIA